MKKWKFELWTPRPLTIHLYLGCVCFGWKWFQEIIFRKIGCLVGLENWIFRKSFSVDRKIVALTTEIHFRSYFHFKWFPELGTCKESSRKGRTKERKNAKSHLRLRSNGAILRSTVRDDRDLCFTRSRRRSQSEITISRSTVRADRNWRFVRSRRRSQDRSIDHEIAPCSSRFVQVFLGFASSFFFSKHQKIFSKNILKCNQTHENIFLSGK